MGLKWNVNVAVCLVSVLKKLSAYQPCGSTIFLCSLSASQRLKAALNTQTTRYYVGLSIISSIKNTCSLSSPFLARLRHAASSSSPIEVRTACCSASIRNTFSSSLTSSDSEARLRSPDLTCGGGERAEWDIVDAN